MNDLTKINSSLYADEVIESFRITEKREYLNKIEPT